MRIAVIGLAPSTHDKAPWDDPSWYLWGLPWDPNWVKLDRYFEMHDLRLIQSEHCRLGSGYLEKLRELYKPLYMQDKYFPEATRYPFEHVQAIDPGMYWNSSIAYMMALAIFEGVEEIGVWGVDMENGIEEFAYQRPNMEYLIGLARGRGIKVTIPEESPLCKFNGKGINYYKHHPTYFERYGQLWQ